MRQLFIPTAIILAISACSSLPDQVIIAPSYTYTNNIKLANAVNLSVKDNRASNATLKVLTDGQTVTTPSNDISQSIQYALKNALQKSNVEVSAAQANADMQVQVHQLEVIVDQQTFKYRSEGIIELQVVLDKGDQQFSKYYNGKNENTGPLKHDRAKLESQINVLLEQLIYKIVNDVELQTFLNG